MPKFTAKQVAAILAKNGFCLRKGEAGQVATAVATGAPPEAVLAAAKRIGLHPSITGCPGDERSDAIEWIAQRMVETMSAQTYLDGIVEEVVNEIVGAAPVGDGSGAMTPETSHDLSKWSTLAEYFWDGVIPLEEDAMKDADVPDVLERWRTLFAQDFYGALGETVELAQCYGYDLSVAITEWMLSLDDGKLGALQDDVYLTLYDRGQDTGWLEREIGGRNFREALLAHRPDMRARLERDITAAARRPKAVPGGFVPIVIPGGRR